MLPCVEPYLNVTATHFEAIDWLAFYTMAKAAVRHTFKRCRLGDEIMVTLHAVRGEICKPGDVTCGDITNRQRAAILRFVIARIGPAPIIAVFGNTGTIVRPAAGIGTALQSANPQFQFLTRGAGHAEVEPLREFRILVLADAQRCDAPIDSVNDDVAAVEGGINVSNRHVNSLPAF